METVISAVQTDAQDSLPSSFQSDACRNAATALQNRTSYNLSNCVAVAAVHHAQVCDGLCLHERLR